MYGSHVYNVLTAFADDLTKGENRGNAMEQNSPIYSIHVLTPGD